MKKIITMCTAMLIAAASHAGNPLTLKAFTDGTYSAKRITGVHPLAGGSEYAQISEDGRQVVKYSFATGKQTGVLFDKEHTTGSKIDAFEDYQLSNDGKYMLIQKDYNRIYRRSFTADFYLYDVKSQQMRQLSAGGPQQVPTFSPDSRRVAFVRANNIFVTDGKQERQITTDGAFGKIINGIPDWVNEEEFSFNNAMAWGGDGATLSWIKYDESRVKTYSLQLFEGSNPDQKEYADYPGLYSYKYPKAGQQNAKVSVWACNIADGQIRQYDLPLDSDGYVPRVLPIEGQKSILIFTMNRHQDVLNIYKADPLTGACKLIIRESVPKYVKEEAMEGIVTTKNHIVLPSDRDGYMHLYLYDMNGKLIRQIDKGSYEVTAVYGYDEATGCTYYQADKKTPMQREVYVALANGTSKALAEQNGWNSAIFSTDFKYFLNTWSDRNTPYIYTIHNQKGKLLRTMLDNKELQDKLKDVDRPDLQFFAFTTQEDVKLNGWMVKPADFDAHKKYPVILFQYSGPGNQQVIDNWGVGSMGNGALFDAYLTQKGYIVVCVDGRGTGGRGADYEKSTYLHIGDLESKDQVETAIWLAKQQYVDSARIGIWGWSFGGFNTLMSMSEGRGVFKAGVAVAPPTNWKYYDTIYTERYMRTPQENADGYAVNPITRADKLHGSLLICHGMADDNVHPQNTFEYAEALVQHDKDFKENYYTNRNHSIYGGNTRNHLLRQIAQWFEQNL